MTNPFNGETFVFTQVDEVPEFAQFDVHLARGGMLTGTGMHHVHPYADEAFTVREGKLILSIDGVRRTLEPGQGFLVRRGVPHHVRNGHDGETLFTCRFTPGHQYLRFFLNMALGAERHPERYDPRGEPPLVLRALALHAYAGHGYTAALPIWFQRALFALLAPVARLRGYRLDVPPVRAGRG
ncbi:cupin domain-containing protein [Methylobacterium crusticola]|uniref:cupin domain-containing protein n=1 Tax=Methylobacterium crusticola TaxID=1697972 RepID=UPI001EE20B46|nr:cupin domain-containing protein [Methylobacterium crusticola]